ncbi:MAG TPA: type II CAAX endopeptidase family protein [Halanaerobiales bacterium]|nr:type II CAAX endopeptidase family protein [Halanaerobiales bacterium]
MQKAKNKLINFFIITIILSWSLWILAILINKNIISIGISTNLLNIMGAFIPSLMGIYLMYSESNKEDFIKFLKKGIEYKFEIKYYLYLFIFPLILFLSYIISQTFFNLNIENSLLNQPKMIPIAFIYILFLGGPLGEEYGWRGFALPRLNMIFKPLYSSIILGFIWSIWHLPLFFIEGSVQQGINFFGYTIFTILISVIFTILFIKTGGSILSAILLHTMTNLSWGMFPVFNHLYASILLLVFLTTATIFLTYINRDIMV